MFASSFIVGRRPTPFWQLTKHLLQRWTLWDPTTWPTTKVRGLGPVRKQLITSLLWLPQTPTLLNLRQIQITLQTPLYHLIPLPDLPDLHTLCMNQKDGQDPYPL